MWKRFFDMSSPFHWACPGKDTSTLPLNVPHSKANKMTKFQLRGFRMVTSRHDFPKQFQHPTASKGMKSEFASASARSFNISCLLTARNSTHFTSTMPCQNTAPDFELWLPFLFGPEVPSWIHWLLRSCSSRCVLTWHHVSCVAKKSLSSYLWWTDIMGFSPQAAAPQKAKGAFRTLSANRICGSTLPEVPNSQPISIAQESFSCFIYSSWSLPQKPPDAQPR